ncbi:PAS domain S-box protein [Methanobacterium spitsbergense]|uniref:PAS domain S-box protein n=1 Tax=Methanobacterium spitsbergense TaxID=2874285 RepID=A0A8T5V0X4_9EURY|nr:PAS domain S-box protein [Methanobacterium spitsbergense]MBZ2167100.1 PAS domain S-box protein [Methanobacterium spitsbergense]
MSAETILVVEDEGITAMGLQRQLRFWGYDVPTFAFSKKEAVQKAKEIKPDLILMDIVLKGDGDGVDAVTEIKKYLDIPIIYLTSYNDKETIKRANITKPFKYILKPFQEKLLRESIEKAIKNKKLENKIIESGEWIDKKMNGAFGVIVTDKDGCVRFLNEAAQKIIRLKTEEANYKKLNDVFRIKKGNSYMEFKDFKYGNQEIPNGKKTELSDSNLIKDIINEGIFNGIKEEVYLSHSEGMVIPIEYNASPILNEGEFLGLTLVFNDISERVLEEKSLFESEHRFKTVYSHFPLGIEIYNIEGQIIDANIAALELFGVETISQLIDFNLFKDFRLNKNEKKLLQEGKTVKSEIEFNFKDFKSFKSYKTTKSDNLNLEIIFKPLKFYDNITIDSYLLQFQDITKHKTIEESLEISKELYKGILGSIKYPFIALDENLKCIYSNKEYEKLIGIPLNETYEKSVWEILPNFKNLKDIEGSVKNSINNKKSAISVFELHNDDQNRFFELNINSMDNGLSIILKDVTESRFNEDELKKREEQYRIVVEDLTEPVCRFDPEGTLTYANKSYKSYFANDDVGSFIYSTPEEEQEKMKEYITSFDKINPIKILESPIKMSDGNIHWWRFVTKAIFDKENIKELQSVSHEITDQKNLEDELYRNIKLLENEIKDKKQLYMKTEKSLKDELTKIKNNEKDLKDLSNELEEKVKETSLELSKTQKDLKTITEEHQITEYQLDQTIEKLENELEDTRIKFETEIEKLQNELTARMKIEEDLNKKYHILEINFDEVTSELTSTRKDMRLEINKHIKTEESINQQKEELQKKLETKKSTLKRVNLDMDKEIAKRTELENQFSITKDTLQKQLNEKQAKHLKSIKKLESGITELKFKNNEISNLLKEKELILKDVHIHTTKNMQRISSLTSLQSDYIRDQMVKSFGESQNHIKSVTLIHEKLLESYGQDKINFSEYVKSLIDDLFISHEVDLNRISKNIQIKNVFLDIDTATSCGLIINELILNSLKHAFPNGKDGMIQIEMYPKDECIEMIITDDGIGLPEILDFQNTYTLGLQLVKTLVYEMNGKIELKNNNGTKYKIKFKNN